MDPVDTSPCIPLPGRGGKEEGNEKAEKLK
jgi:hypothetical protein